MVIDDSHIYMQKELLVSLEMTSDRSSQFSTLHLAAIIGYYCHIHSTNERMSTILECCRMKTFTGSENQSCNLEGRYFLSLIFDGNVTSIFHHEMILKTISCFESFSSLNRKCNYFCNKCEKISWDSNTSPHSCLYKAYLFG